MKSDDKRPLAKGQVWRTGVADIEIMALGKRLIHYRITKQLGHRGVSSQIGGIPAMEDYPLQGQSSPVGQRGFKQLMGLPDQAQALEGEEGPHGGNFGQFAGDESGVTAGGDDREAAGVEFAFSSRISSRTKPR